MNNDPTLPIEIRKKRVHRKREILVRTIDTLDRSRRDIDPEEHEFREIVGHEVDVYGKTLGDSIMYLEMTQIDGPLVGDRCRLHIWAARRWRWWPWSPLELRVRVTYNF